MTTDPTPSVSSQERLFSKNTRSRRSRLAPSHFQFERAEAQELFLYPYPVEMIWKTVATCIQKYSVQSPLSLLPPWWQLDRLFSTTVRAARLPVSVTPPSNLPLAVKMAEMIATDMILISYEHMVEMREAFEKKGLSKNIKVWVVVASLDTKLPTLLETRNVYIERQAMPGWTVLYQCEHMIPSVNHFHPNTSYLYEFEKDGCFISSADNIVPECIQRRYVPALSMLAEKCVCGKKIMEYAS